MPKWKRRIDINKYFVDEALSDREAARLAVERLDVYQHAFGVQDFEALLERLREAIEAEDWDLFDVRMEQVYCIADERRICLADVVVGADALGRGLAD